MRILVQVILGFCLSSCYLGCSSVKETNRGSWDFECFQGKPISISTPEQAIEIAIYFLEKHGVVNYDKYSVKVTDEQVDYSITFEKKENVLPHQIFLLVRKADGCVAQIPLK